MIFSLKIQNYLIFHFIHNNLSGKSFCLHSGRAEDQQHLDYIYYACLFTFIKMPAALAILERKSRQQN